MLLTVQSRPFLATALPMLLSGAFACADLPFGFLASSLQAQQSHLNEIRWFEELAPAIQYATTNNLPLMLHFYGDNCPPCRLLERKAFKNQELIGKMNSQVVAVRINAEKDKDLRTRYSITRWPTDVFLTASGKELYRSVSPQDPAVYGKLIDRMALRNRDWNIEQNVAAQAAERRFTNQTSTQQVYNQPANPMTLASGGSSPTLSVSPVSHASKPASQIAPQTISFDHLSAPAVSINPLAESESSGAGGLPIIIAGQGAPASKGQTISNPFVNAAPTDHPTALPTPDGLPTIYGPNGASLGMTNLGPTNQVSDGGGIPVHMASSPTSMRSASSNSVNPQDIAATASNLPAADATPETTVGLDGYCPVTLFMAVKGEIDQSNCWTQGLPKFAVKHRGRIYMCASEEMRQRFLKGPDIYSPCLSGFDLIHYIKTQELVDGKCEFGCFQGDTGRIFLFANQENSNEFRQKEAFYSRLVNANQPERVATQPDATQVR